MCEGAIFPAARVFFIFLIFLFHFFSMKIYATAGGTQVADANIKYTLPKQ